MNKLELRGLQSQDTLRGEYDTTILMLDSQRGSNWTGSSGTQTGTNGKSNNSFVCVLNTPLILDRNYEYVVAIIKTSFDITNYTTAFTSFNITCDQIQYQYYNNGQLQILHKTNPIKNTNSTVTGQYSPYVEEPKNLVWRYISSANKTISRITFEITDDNQGYLNSVNPLIPTQIQLAIKKVSPSQQY